MSATTTQVITTWLSSLSGVPDDKVGPSLPSNMSIWASSGFYQVHTVGGNPDPDLATHMPVIEVSCWAATPNAEQAPYNRAEAMAEYVAQQAHAFRSARIAVQTGWNPQVLANVFLIGVLPVTEPVRVPDTNTEFARVKMELQLWWNGVA